MRQTHLINITLKSGMTFQAKVSNDDLEEFAYWLTENPTIAKYEQLSTTYPIKPHTSSGKWTKLTAARMAAGMTQEQLGNTVGRSGRAVWKWEHNFSQPPAKVLAKLAEVLGVDVADLIEND